MSLRPYSVSVDLEETDPIFYRPFFMCPIKSCWILLLFEVRNLSTLTDEVSYFAFLANSGPQTPMSLDTSISI